ncbi:uncharacterized protein LOC114330104 [Diabrotica virgifera virgifera]|uniref:Uncharacterized protein LOC114330104 n=1 Tax=Diabrotica virgifera virgifera TaxID=50390 RepID=A0A6P7FQE3_DIAVI|nr:uncharacterized protein LOC114330104 [Diabrotica virgifera virgifera]
MKVLTLTFVLFVPYVISQNIAQFTPLIAAHQACASRTGIQPDLVSGMLQGRFPNNPALADHLFCIHKRLGIQDSDGSINTNRIGQLAGIIAPNASPERIQEVINVCAVQKGSPGATALDMDRCLYNQAGGALG